MKEKHIYPIEDRLLQRTAKEKQLNQKAKVLWMTGLSGSGKSTVAQHLEAKLYKAGFMTKVLDGDNVRSGLNNNLSFAPADRLENIRRISEVSKLFLNAGIITINSFISPTIAMRAMARDIVGADDFLEIYISTPLEVCEDRDVKGLYQKARSGEIKGFTGIDAPYEAPQNPALEVKTQEMTIEEAVDKVFNFIVPQISL